MSLLLLLDGPGLPEPTVECAFASDPLDAAPTWTDVTDFVDVSAGPLETSRGRHNEMDRIEAASARLRLSNTDRRFDPTHTGSPYHPNVVPLRRMRIRFKHAGATHFLYSGHVTNWPPRYEGPEESYVDLELVDGFEFQAIAQITSTLASRVVGAGDAALRFVAKSHKASNEITVELRDDNEVVPRVVVVGRAISIHLARLFTNVEPRPLVTTANDVIHLVRGDSAASQLVDVELAPGSGGGAVAQPLPPTALTGATYTEERSGARVNRVLDDVGAPAAPRAIDAGVSRVASSGFAASAEQKALPHLQEVADSELGVFFYDGQGGPVFHDRHHRLQKARLTPRYVFGDAGDELPYEEYAPDFDRQRVWNDVRVSRAEADSPQQATDAASRTRYGHRVLSRSTLLTTDGECADQAAGLRNRYREPRLRLPRIRIMPLIHPVLWEAVLTLELGDRIATRKRPPGGGGVLSHEWHVEHITHRIGGRLRWETVLELSPADAETPWILGDPVYGVLGQTTRIKY